MYEYAPMLSKYPYISVQKIMLPHPVKEHERRAMLEGLFEMLPEKKLSLPYTKTTLAERYGRVAKKTPE